ncbi:hypothetical protein CYLTODRAFT_488928 [Cylindrobasidium torrendii FP15055 ss-10]|uniref:Proteophosphoglycan ppg4 n=1 Tax=Cylindrobasidium torrendii FP15055 ss-10 TaxID=1314674 RepID=A0A0D7BIE5_9AGAR|nr:hypothetical protein CYLTODRAFT_488928 [Cylindrobasidium torrendii FP15055 ss-10]
MTLRYDLGLLRPFSSFMMQTISVALLSLVLSAQARPTEIAKRAESSGSPSDGGGSSVKIWAPIVGVVVGLLLLVAIAYSRKSWRKSITESLGTFSLANGFVPTAAVAPTSSATPNVRELTADQLAGPGSRQNSVRRPAVPPPTTARRVRRPRRTPSQISTTSLPAYNKEPGEEELVIFRGQEDMEDAPIEGLTAHVEMPVDEDESSEDHSTGDHAPDADSRRASQYGRVPDTPHDQPLLNREHEDHHDNMPVRSVDQEPTPVDGLPVESDPRGPAPAYFEVSTADLADGLSALPENTPPTAAEAQVPSQTTDAQTEDPSADPNATARRRSTFRNMLGGVFNNRSTIRSPDHTRGASNASAATTSESRHRASNSLSFFRAQSHASNTSNVPLTSPSMISINSISAPLTHTVLRTEFTYPRSGPTADQVKLISSRDAFSRFGMPYGNDAIRYASQSRLGFNDVEEDTLPPEFDEPNGSRARLRSGSPTHAQVGASTTSLLPPAESPMPSEPADQAGPPTHHRRDSSASSLPFAPDSSADFSPPAQPLSSRSATFAARTFRHQPKDLSRSSSTGALRPKSSGDANPPPSSFSPELPPGAAPPLRAVSRASTYATAADSFRTATGRDTPASVDEFGFQPNDMMEEKFGTAATSHREAAASSHRGSVALAQRQSVSSHREVS